MSIVTDTERAEQTVDPSPGTHAACLTCSPDARRGLCGTELLGVQRLPHTALDCVVCADLLNAGRCPHCNIRFGSP